MLELKDREWAEFKVGDIFEFTRGKRITTAFASENPGKVPVIAGGEQNNGILCYLDENCRTTRVLKDSCISVAAYGTAGCVHYHGYKCFIDDKAIALNISQKSFDNKQVNLFMVAILSSLQARYSYGRGVTVDRYSNEVIHLPVDVNGQPDYDFMEQYIAERSPDYSWAKGCIEPNAEISLSDREWAEFKVGDILALKVAKSNDKGNLSVGDVPFIGRSNNNNGLQGFYDAPNITQGKCITLGMVGTFRAFWQENDFAASQNILTLRAPWLNQNTGLFICNCIETAIAGKFSYGKSIKAGTFGDTILSLPINDAGQPDYDFMERYMKSLPFSKVLE